MGGCVTNAGAGEFVCRDTKAASHLKLISILVIFFTSVLGISFPVLLARSFQGKPAYDRAVLLIKCFAAGVILSTSLVHVLPDAFASLSDCSVASRHPWRDFPFSGLLALLGALLALFVDLTATSHVEHAHAPKPQPYKYKPLVSPEDNDKKKHAHTHVDVDAEHGHELEPVTDPTPTGPGCHNPAAAAAAELDKLKQRLVSQVLEIGIIFHSVIIGVTMGMSQNQCTIKPLVAALAFHQIFEGMGLGGCIAQAGFSFTTTTYMCFMFSVTTPMGIVLGMIVFWITGYDDSNANALIMEGLLGSLSSGILIYMALVDLIAVDFFHNKQMDSITWMKKASFIALTVGSASMSILALWA